MSFDYADKLEAKLNQQMRYKPDPNLKFLLSVFQTEVDKLEKKYQANMKSLVGDKKKGKILQYKGSIKRCQEKIA